MSNNCNTVLTAPNRNIITYKYNVNFFSLFVLWMFCITPQLFTYTNNSINSNTSSSSIIGVKFFFKLTLGLKPIISHNN